MAPPRSCTFFRCGQPRLVWPMAPQNCAQYGSLTRPIGARPMRGKTRPGSARNFDWFCLASSSSPPNSTRTRTKSRIYATTHQSQTPKSRRTSKSCSIIRRTFKIATGRFAAPRQACTVGYRDIHVWLIQIGPDSSARVRSAALANSTSRYLALYQLQVAVALTAKHALRHLTRSSSRMRGRRGMYALVSSTGLDTVPTLRKQRETWLSPEPTVTVMLVPSKSFMKIFV
ncbi:hypothetical protein BC828DRAFT_393063 [Blastocladiella britannica]|nr:hypothetical protein BC828DRAFT_393063 [Blastocladiella britannica]